MVIAAGEPLKAAPRRLVECSADVRCAVLIDSAGNLVAASEDDRSRAWRLADLARELVEAADAAAPEPTEQIEARVEGGGVFAVRTPRHTLACVTRRLALPALVLYDLRQTITALEQDQAGSTRLGRVRPEDQAGSTRLGRVRPEDQ